MTVSNKNISVLFPIGQAVEKTGEIFFRPFNLEKWLIIGFCAWLANLFQEVIGGGFGYKFDCGQNYNNGQIPSHILEFCRIYQIFILPIAFIAVVVFFAIAILLIWISSRGKFMFLDCLAKNTAHVKQPWKTFAKEANSLFRLRLFIAIVFILIITPLSILTAVLSYALFSNSVINRPIAGLIFLGLLLVFFLVLLLSGAIWTLTFDLVVPIMYLQRTGAFAAWGIFLPLIGQNLWKIILYLLFKLLLTFCLGIITSLVILTSCCCCCVGVIFFLPYIGTVALLPLSSFYILYSLCFLRQFGSEFDVFERV